MKQLAIYSVAIFALLAYLKNSGKLDQYAGLLS